MAHCNQTAQEFIQETFGPMVAVLCSHDANVVCQKNNLSFVELVQPFSRLSAEAQIRDPGNIAHTVRNLRVHFQDMNSQPPNPTLAKKILGDSVANSQPQIPESSRNSVLSFGNYDLQLSASTPWYEAYRDCFLQVAYPSDHEFLKHFLASVFVVSSQHPEPMEQFAKLTSQQHTQQHQHPHKLPKWFCPNVLRYYVLVHDSYQSDEAKAENIYQQMKTAYGMNACHLLHINSRPLDSTEPTDQANVPNPWSHFLQRNYQESGDVSAPLAKPETLEPMELPKVPNVLSQDSVEEAAEATETDVLPQNSMVINHPLAVDTPSMSSSVSMPDINGQAEMDNRVDSQNNPVLPPSSAHGACLTLSDHDRIRIFVHEFMVRGLFPWAERQLRLLNDQLMSRKGIHRSLFSATKKWFGSNRTGVPNTVQEKTNVVYTTEAPEMQMRRMADLAFMFQLYEMAYQAFHTAKRDFKNDHAWLYNAGAQEMACLSVFMQGNNSQRQYPHHYMDAAVTTYLSCAAPHFATRATILSTECLKSKGMYAEAAMQFIKMTSEDSDLRSALLLEQAAHCFINMKTPMVRKYAFHMILAGHRFSKAAQRKHALRSYAQALQVYKGKSWSLAEDHINFTIGRQSFNLRQLDNSTAAFKHLLTMDSQQSAIQQSAFLREYLFVYKQLSQLSPDGIVGLEQLPQLPLPVVDGNKTKVLLGRIMPEPIGDKERQLASSVTFDTAEQHQSTWQKLEELVAVQGLQKLPVNFRHSLQCFTNKTNNSSNPIAVVSEPVTLEVAILNPLKIPLVLTDVLPLWKFTPQSHSDSETPGTSFTNESDNPNKIKIANEAVETEMLSELVLQGAQECKVHMCLQAKQTGELSILGLTYNLATIVPSIGTGSTPAVVSNNSNESNAKESPLATNTSHNKSAMNMAIKVRGRLNLEVSGPRLNTTKAEKTGKLYGPDRRLDLLVVPPMPLLQIELSNFPQHLFCGEVQQTIIHFSNIGEASLHKLRVVSTQPEFFTFGPMDKESHADNASIYPTIANTADSDSDEYPSEEAEVTYVLRIPMEGKELGPGRSASVPMWIRGPVKPGLHQVHFLFVYESLQESPKLKYRVLRHTAVINVSQSIGLRAVASRGCSSRHDNSQQLNSIDVSLEVENLSQINDPQISEVNLLQVSCASARWHLNHLSTQRHTDIKISPKESILMCFAAQPCQHSTEESSKKIVFTNVTFDQHQIHSAVAPCADFYFKAKKTLAFDQVEVETPNNALFPIVKKPSAELIAINNLKNTQKIGLTLIVLWKAQILGAAGEKHSIVGQHHVTVDKLQSPVISPIPVKGPIEQPPVKIIKDKDEDDEKILKTDELENLVKYHFHHKQHHTHDFSKSRLCVVPVVLEFLNTSAVELKVEVSTMKKSSEQTQKAVMSSSLSPAHFLNALEDRPGKRFSWAGKSLNTLTLAGRGKGELHLRACFTASGVYDLSTLHVSARPSVPSGSLNANLTVDFTRQKPLAPSVIFVDSLANSSNS